MQHLTSEMIAQAMNDLQDQFDSHALEKRTLRRFTIPFAQEILRFAHTDDPLLQFSAAFARFVDRTFAEQLIKTEKVPSENLGGEQSLNQKWKKRATTIVTPA